MELSHAGCLCLLRGSLNATGTAAVFSLPFSFSRYLYRVLGGVKLTSCAHRQSTVQMEVCVHLRDSRGSGGVRRVSAQQVRCLWRRQIRSFSPGVFSSDAASESDLSRAPYFSKIKRSPAIQRVHFIRVNDSVCIIGRKFDRTNYSCYGATGIIMSKRNKGMRENERMSGYRVNGCGKHAHMHTNRANSRWASLKTSRKTSSHQEPQSMHRLT